jgi:hypothetical protein
MGEAGVLQFGLIRTEAGYIEINLSIQTKGKRLITLRCGHVHVSLARRSSLPLRTANARSSTVADGISFHKDQIRVPVHQKRLTTTYRSATASVPGPVHCARCLRRRPEYGCREVAREQKKRGKMPRSVRNPQGFAAWALSAPYETVRHLSIYFR